MEITDEAALRRRLRDELNATEIGPAPVDAVFRYRAARLRRVTAAAVIGASVVAITAGVLEARGHARPLLVSSPSLARGAVFASGRHWQLAAIDLAAPGYRCLPGVIFNGQNGDLLQGAIPPGLALGDAGFLAWQSGTPTSGLAFLRLRPGLRDLKVSLGDRTTLQVAAHVVTLCGQHFRLAGFVWPAQGVRQITASSASGHVLSFRPDPYLFNPIGNLLAQGWFNYQGLTADVASGTIGSSSLRGTAWQAHVTLGSNGECFWIDLAPGGGSVSICLPIGVPYRTASLEPLTYATPSATLIWYVGTVNIGTAYATARLSDGATERITATVVGGRKYVAVGFVDPVRLTRLTLYDASGHVLARIAKIPQVI